MGQTAPALTVEELNGQPFDLAGERGKVTIVNFWATWCEPCRKEIPALEAIYRRYHDQGLEVIGMSADRPHDRASVKEMAQSMGYPAAMLEDARGQRFRLAHRVAGDLCDRSQWRCARQVHARPGRVDGRIVGQRLSTFAPGKSHSDHFSEGRKAIATRTPKLLETVVREFSLVIRDSYAMPEDESLADLVVTKRQYRAWRTGRDLAMVVMLALAALAAGLSLNRFSSKPLPIDLSNP